MAKLLQSSLVFIAIAIIATMHNVPQSSSNMAPPQNITLFSYVALQGPNSTTGYNAAQCGGPTKHQPDDFARTFCYETPLLQQTDPSLQPMGVLKGTYTFISLSEPGSTLLVSETFSFYNPQGTVSATGVQAVWQVSSKPIIGGTDAFAFLIGIVTTTPLSNEPFIDSNGNAVSWFKLDLTFRPASNNW